MGKLGIDPKMVIRATCKKYIDTLPTDQAEAYVEEMRSAVGEAIQQKIDEAETWLTAAENICSERHRRLHHAGCSGRVC